MRLFHLVGMGYSWLYKISVVHVEMCTKSFKKNTAATLKMSHSVSLKDFFFWLLFIFVVVVVVFVLNYLDRDPNSELLPLSEWCEIYFFINILFLETLINKSFSKNTSMFLKGFECFLVIPENFVTVRDTKFHFNLDVCFVILFSVTWMKLLKWSKNNH